MKVRKKPVVVDAIQFTGMNAAEIEAWTNRAVAKGDDEADHGKGGQWMLIHTLEGVMRADVGDWIICGVKGEFYPCKPDVFADTYEIIDATPAAGGKDEMIRIG